MGAGREIIRNMDNLTELEFLILRAKQACEGPVGTHEYEGAFLSVLNYMKEHPMDEDAYKNHFIRMLSERALGPWELIAFCMRELQWPEVLKAARERLEKMRDPRIKSVMADVIEVYEPNWPDSVLYDYYSRKDIAR
jgi:hypothetical protein